MARHLAAIIAAFTLLNAPAARQSQPPLVSVGPNVQVSASKPSTMHSEGLIVADPTNAKRLLVCSMFWAEEIGDGIVTYLSEDGGKHWERTFDTTRREDLGGDPACVYGPDGTAYLMMMPMKVPALAKMRLPLRRSDDGGRTWRTLGVIGGVDRESLVVDGTGGQFHNRIYAHGSATVSGPRGPRRNTLELYASSDGGRTFGRPATHVPFGRGYIFGADNSVILSDGRWLTVFCEFKDYWDSADSTSHSSDPFGRPPEPENAWLKAIASDDGGDSLTAPVTISGWHMPSVPVRKSMPMASVAADSSTGPFNDRLYVVWPDTRFGGTDILLSYSSDRGQTWTPSIVVNDDHRPAAAAAAPNHLLPSVAVNKNGIVAVTWLDRRDEPDNLGWRVRVRASLDGGETFLPSRVVSEVPTRFDGREQWPSGAGTTGGGTPVSSGGLLRVLIVGMGHHYFPGDYAGLAADRDGAFHPYWIDNRTGWHQVWTAAIDVAATATKNGSSDLSALEDLTPLTTLYRVTSSYDRATQTATVTVRLQNTSTKSISGPFWIRVVSLNSEVGTVDAVGATNGATGPGASWNVTSYVEGADLAPGAASRPLILSFKLHDVRPTLQRRGDTRDNLLVEFFARVLGHSSQ